MRKLQRMKKGTVFFGALVLCSFLIVGFAFEEKRPDEIWYMAVEKDNIFVPGVAEGFWAEGSDLNACVPANRFQTVSDRCRGKIVYQEDAGWVTRSLHEYWVEKDGTIQSLCSRKNLGYKTEGKKVKCQKECPGTGEAFCRSTSIFTPGGQEVKAGYCECPDRAYLDTDYEAPDGINPQNVGCIRQFPQQNCTPADPDTSFYMFRDYCYTSTSLVEYYAQDNLQLKKCAVQGHVESKKINCKDWCDNEQATCKKKEEGICGGNSSGFTAAGGYCFCG